MNLQTEGSWYQKITTSSINYFFPVENNLQFKKTIILQQHTRTITNNYYYYILPLWSSSNDFKHKFPPLVKVNHAYTVHLSVNTHTYKKETKLIIYNTHILNKNN